MPMAIDSALGGLAKSHLIILYCITSRWSCPKANISPVDEVTYICLEISRYYPEMEEIKMNTEDKVQKYFKCYICNRIILYLINCQIQRWLFLVQPNEIIALHCYPVLLFKTLSFRSSTSHLIFFTSFKLFSYSQDLNAFSLISSICVFANTWLEF